MTKKKNWLVFETNKQTWMSTLDDYRYLNKREKQNWCFLLLLLLYTEKKLLDQILPMGKFPKKQWQWQLNHHHEPRKIKDFERHFFGYCWCSIFLTKSSYLHTTMMTTRNFFLDQRKKRMPSYVNELKKWDKKWKSDSQPPSSSSSSSSCQVNASIDSISENHLYR